MLSRALNSFTKITTFVLVLGLIQACGSDSNRVSESEINRNGGTFNPGNYGTAQEAVNGYLLSNPCAGGAQRIVTQFHTSATSTGSQTALSGSFSPGLAPGGGSITKVFIGRNLDFNDIMVVREIGGGAVANYYDVELHFCTVGGINPGSSFSNFQAVIILDTNIGQTLGSIDSALTQINYTSGGTTVQLGQLPGFPYEFSPDFIN